MSLFETLRLALINLALHKFRSLLAALGIILGVASVECMISIVEGAKQESLARFHVLGVDNITLNSVKPSKSEKKKSDNENSWGADEYGLLRRDLDHIRRTFPMVRLAVGLRNMRATLYSRTGRPLEAQVLATEPEYLVITRSSIAQGRFLTDLDDVQHKRVAVVGVEAARKLLGFQDPMNSSVQINGNWYRIVGVLENRAALKAPGGEDINNCVFIPLGTARALYGDVSYRRERGTMEYVKVQLDGIAIQLDETSAVVPTAMRLQNYLGKTHRDKDYNIQVPLELMQQKEAETRTFAIVMGSIAGISLIVGGIGIMNIMLANVYDRRKEIGTRRALGARRRDIIYQFLFEASTLTSMGGLFGAMLGYLCTPLIRYYAHWPTIFNGWSAVLGIAVSCFVGIVFGLWPAYQAAKVNPIEALRSE